MFPYLFALVTLLEVSAATGFSAKITRFTKKFTRFEKITRFKIFASKFAVLLESIHHPKTSLAIFFNLHDAETWKI